ncbi:MAG: hypothetical protein RBQ94_01895 [Methanimicrococcus sp.]|nr:hypothetical protein [Methanimicrococcus sp.]
MAKLKKELYLALILSLFLMACFNFWYVSAHKTNFSLLLAMLTPMVVFCLIMSFGFYFQKKTPVHWKKAIVFEFFVLILFACIFYWGYNAGYFSYYDKEFFEYIYPMIYNTVLFAFTGILILIIGFVIDPFITCLNKSH